MTDFLNSINDISNKLAVVGEPISDSYLVAYTLPSLPNDYESFIDSIETRTESVIILHGLLLSKEISMQKRKSRLSSSSSSVPFYAYNAQQGSLNRDNFHGRYQNQNR